MTDVEAPIAPFLFIDLYPLDFDNPATPRVIEDPPWEQLLADVRVRGVILKATDGTRYGYVDWFLRSFHQLSLLLGADRGVTKLLGGYGFLQLTQPGGPQGETLVAALERAGWGEQDIVPVLDVELGNERHPNRRASAQQVIDCTTAAAERIRELTGRESMLYGRGAMRDLGIKDRMGCSRVWNPSYTRTMVMNGLLPWALDDVVIWQYGGDGVGDTGVHHLPLDVAGHKVDLSVSIDGAHAVTWERTRSRLVDPRDCWAVH